jgi:drug/metabolite transporter (DMT)-like permease
LTTTAPTATVGLWLMGLPSVTPLGYVDMTRVGEPQSRATAASWVLLAVGIAAASLSAIFTRYADGAGALTVSFWRCAGGSALLMPFAARRVRSLTRSEARSCIVAGVFLGVHFAAWISSLYLTTVSSASLLVSTTPIFVAVAARLLWADRLSRIGWWGIGLATVGSVVVAGADLGGSSLTGDMLALFGGAAGAGYALGGQVARRTVGVVEYSAVAYAIAAIMLAVAAVVAGSPFTGFDRVTWQAIVALTLVPQVLGHTLINITLKDLHATVVSVTIMAEPIIATYLAYVLFDESPSLLTIPGGIAILAGIYLVSRAFPSDSVIPE